MNGPTQRLTVRATLAVSLALTTHLALAIEVIIDFEELPLSIQDYYNGSDGAGGFETKDTWLNNQFDDYGGDCCWNGWAYSQTTDTTTPGFTNQYSASTGGGAEGSAKYAVAFNGFDAGFGIIPEITLPDGAEPTSVLIANTTYAALSMLNGDSFAKKFGGLSGNDPDWFLLEVEGVDISDSVVGSVPLYLADYRFSNSSEDYILDEWTELDLSTLAGLGVEKLAFRLSSSDNSIFGMNTPSYLAIDNLVIDVPVTPGDFDNSGTVDSLDLAIWETNYGETSGITFSDGDANEDGKVDGRDFLLWQQHFDPGGVVVLQIPEPSAFKLLLYSTSLTYCSLCRRI